MKMLRYVRLLVVLPVVALSASMGTLRADEVNCSTFPTGIVTGDVNANLIVDCHCTIASGSLVNGNIEQPDSEASWNITVQAGADINGNIDDYGRGSVRVVVGPGQFFDDDITERSRGNVIVRVLDGGTYDGNVEENGLGSVIIRVQASGLFNGNSYEYDAGNMSTAGSGMYNGSTRQEGPGVCANSISNFNGSPCE